MTVKFADTPTYTSPSKFDIIPIHASDRGAFKYCRRQWGWSSPSRLNLVPRADVYGIRENLWFGTGIHYALEKYYSSLRENPVVTWETWWNLECHGGLISAEDVHHFTHRDPEYLPQFNAYRVKGLDDVLPYYDSKKFEELLDLGRGMMTYYKEFAEANDDFTVIATEHDFSVPILDKDDNPLYMVDARLMPDSWEPDFTKENAFGSLMREGWDDNQGNYIIEKQCHARGRMDIIIQDNESGRYGIKDYKTAIRVDENYFSHLDLDEQCTTYLTLGEVEAIIYDLPYKKLEFITYEALLKAYPKPPTILKNGMPSVNRNGESTTPEMFAEYINSNPVFKTIYDNDTKYQSYYEWLVETKDKRFINRKDYWRNSFQRINARIRLYFETIDMLSDPVLYPTPRKEYNCLNCVFRTPCIQAEAGDDYISTLEAGYISNWNR